MRFSNPCESIRYFLSPSSDSVIHILRRSAGFSLRTNNFFFTIDSTSTEAEGSPMSRFFAKSLRDMPFSLVMTSELNIRRASSWRRDKLMICLKWSLSEFFRLSRLMILMRFSMVLMEFRISFELVVMREVLCLKIE